MRPAGAPHVPRKRFGQHFLRDYTVISRIVQAIRPAADDRLVEIGPGLGALTVPLLAAVNHLDVIELDRDLLEPLRIRSGAASSRLRIHQADALRFDFSALRGSGLPLRLCGNLPYNISTPLLFHLLTALPHWQDAHFMLQRDVVERMAASPGDKSYGRLSVMLQAHCQVEALFSVGPDAFRPPPKVYSAVVRLVPRGTSAVAVEHAPRFAELVQSAFAQRRKTLRNSLAGLLTPVQMASVGVDPGARPETLSLAAFVALSAIL